MADDTLRRLERAARANPLDPQARAALAVAERRAGRGIGSDVEVDALEHILVAPFVSTAKWAAVRTGFRSIVLVRPGDLWQVKGYAHWMSWKMFSGATGALAPAIDVGSNVKARTPCLAGRVTFNDGASSTANAKFIDDLIEWASGDCMTRGVGPNTNVQGAVAFALRQAMEARMSLNDWRARQQVGLNVSWQVEERYMQQGIDSGQLEEVKTERTKESWSLEHVKLHCGLSPISDAEETEPLGPVKVRTCDRCRSVEGRERPTGDVLCFDCWRMTTLGRQR